MPRDKSPPPQPGAVEKVVAAPKQGETKPAKVGKPYNPIGHLGDYAHPPKKKGKK